MKGLLLCDPEDLSYTTRGGREKRKAKIMNVLRRERTRTANKVLRRRVGRVQSGSRLRRELDFV